MNVLGMCVVVESGNMFTDSNLMDHTRKGTTLNCVFKLISFKSFHVMCVLLC